VGGPNKDTQRKFVDETRTLAKADRERSGTLKHMANDAKVSDQTIRRFVDNKIMHRKTYYNLAVAIRSGLETRNAASDPANYAYTTIRSGLGVRDEHLAFWLTKHQGVYITFRPTSSDEKLQVSRLEIGGASGIVRYVHRHKRAKLELGEPDYYEVEGHIFPVDDCAHFVSATEGRMRHIVMQSIERRTKLSYMVGLLVAVADDRTSPFASRILAIRAGDDPNAELPIRASDLGLYITNDAEDLATMELGVYHASSLPTVARLLRNEFDKGLLRAEPFLG
jgi:hypothetical protein